MIWEVIPIEGDENAANQPDYLIMNFYKDSVQQNNQVNFYELGRSVYSKMSKKNLIKNGRTDPMELEIHIS